MQSPAAREMTELARRLDFLEPEQTEEIENAITQPRPVYTSLPSKRIGDQRGDTKVHVKEAKPAPLSNLKLAAKFVYLFELAAKKKEMEAQKALGGKSQDEKPKELLK